MIAINMISLSEKYINLIEGKSDIEILVNGIFARMKYEYKRYAKWKNALPKPEKWKVFPENLKVFWLKKVYNENERHSRIIRNCNYALVKAREKWPHTTKEDYSDGEERGFQRKQCILCKKIFNLRKHQLGCKLVATQKPKVPQHLDQAKQS